MTSPVKGKAVYSIIIPVYNASATIKKCLDRLLSQIGQRTDCEIIAVDDGSTDATGKILKEYDLVKTIFQENQGPAKARNRGVEEAEGDIVLFIDSDCEPFPDWVDQMTLPFRNDDIVGVKGAYKTKQKEITARFVQCEYEDKYEKMQKHKYIDFIDTYSAGFRKNVFLESGGYDVEFPVACAEDVELSYRLSRKGYKMVFNPDAKTYHLHPSSLKAYLVKKYKFAHWRILAVKKNPAKITSDSHTPQVMKMQLLLSPVMAVSSFLSLFSAGMTWISILSISCFLLVSTPFICKALTKDLLVGLASPFFLFLRGLAQFAGVMNGLRYVLKGTMFKVHETA